MKGWMIYSVDGLAARPLSAYGRVIGYACRRLAFGRNGESGDLSILARQYYKTQLLF